VSFGIEDITKEEGDFAAATEVLTEDWLAKD
jgi:hypothetical protein